MLTSSSENIQASPVTNLSIDLIDTNPSQARTEFKEEKLDELAASIEHQGVISPILVRPHPNQEGRYQLVYGERRLRASKLAGLGSIPARIQALADNQLAEIGLTENLQREGLTPLEEAHMFEQLLHSGSRSFSIRSLAERMGKDKSYITDRLALLTLPEDLLTLLKTKPGASLRALSELKKLPNVEDRAPMVQLLANDEANTQQVIQYVKRFFSDPPASSQQPVIQEALKKMSSRIEASLREGQKVKVMYLALDPSTRDKDQILEQLQPLRDLIKTFEELP